MDKYDVRRLEKAAREKDKKYLVEWGTDFERRLSAEMKKNYDKAFEKEILNMVHNFLISVAYTLHFSEETNLNKEKTISFMEDFYSTLDLFRTGEYKPEEYEELLKNDGVEIAFDYNYSEVYEERQEKLNSLIDEYEKKLKETVKE